MTPTSFDRGNPDLTDEGTLRVIEEAALVADGPRVRVVAAVCAHCGADVLPGVLRALQAPADVGAFTVAAGVIRVLSQQWHNDDCPGPVAFATEPIE